MVLLGLFGAEAARAQVTCVHFTVPAQARAEGLAELMGDLIVQCDASGVTSASVVTTATVTLNTNVTNNRDFGQGANVTDAILAVNEVLAPAPTPVSTPSAVPNTPGPQYGTLLNATTLQWPGVMFPVPGVAPATPPARLSGSPTFAAMLPYSVSLPGPSRLRC